MQWVLTHSLICILAACVAFFVGLALRPTEPCSVVITGESVTIRACIFSGEFVDYAKALHVAHHPGF
ncbi:triple gene block protein 3 [Elderberry carlavirus D]|uniref:Movement protein TGBp3 n=1 Tax=Elderberry carlavirus D TaxID=1569055 RepID=A0A0A7MDU1_9VIRU|nr:triple gene block protein 3 [Elderberry carlavirus D]AIZ76634.1 triple gene block protein 3 [Elderberry carlavirus D]